MKHRIVIEIDAKAVGQAFACTDDRAQAEMINTMALELKLICGTDGGMQVCALSNHIDKNGKWLINELKSFFDIREGGSE